MSTKLSGFSYSLYALHCPLIFFLISLLVGAGVVTGDQPGLRNYVLFLMIFALVVISSWMFSLFTEDKTPQVRLFLRRFAASHQQSGSARLP